MPGVLKNPPAVLEGIDVHELVLEFLPVGELPEGPAMGQQGPLANFTRPGWLAGYCRPSSLRVSGVSFSAGGVVQRNLRLS